MKTYTTPTIAVDIPDGAELLAAAESVTVAARGSRRTIEKEGAAAGTTVTAVLTQAETAALGAGEVWFEVTVKLPGGEVVKTETVTARLEDAVLRREV